MVVVQRNCNRRRQKVFGWAFFYNIFVVCVRVSAKDGRIKVLFL